MTATHHRESTSRAAQEYLLALRSLTDAEKPASIASVARRMNVSSQAASEMVARMRTEGLVANETGREVMLTARGRAAADDIFRRHALVEWLLSEVVGMGWAASDAEAHHLQGAISDEVEARLDEFLGHPPTCPHGNPIDAATAKTRPTGVPLSTLKSGDSATIYRITEDAEDDAALLSYLEARGLRPGAQIEVKASSGSLDSISFEGPRGSATLGMRPAALIMVIPGHADASLFHHLPERT